MLAISPAAATLDLPPAAIELLAHLLVVYGHALEIRVGEAEDAHVCVCLPDARAPEADLLHRGHDAREEAGAEDRHELRARDVVGAFLDRQPDRLPHLLGEEPIPQQVAPVDGELLALVAFLLGQVRIVVTGGEHQGLDSAPRFYDMSCANGESAPFILIAVRRAEAPRVSCASRVA